jgi:hypothetical protein
MCGSKKTQAQLLVQDQGYSNSEAQTTLEKMLSVKPHLMKTLCHVVASTVPEPFLLDIWDTFIRSVRKWMDIDNSFLLRIFRFCDLGPFGADLRR